MSARVFISHVYAQRALAGAWKTLLEETSQGALEVSLSGDNGDHAQLAAADHFITVVTPDSLSTPSSLWECGVAVGLNKPLSSVVHAMSLRELPHPLSTYRAYDGDAPEAVVELCVALVRAAGLEATPAFWSNQLAKFQDRVSTLRPRREIAASLVERWVQRFHGLAAAHRSAELPHLVDIFYLSLGEKRPVDSRIHDHLSEVLLKEKRPLEALTEVDFALSLSPDDVYLLHRKGLILMELTHFDAAEQLLAEVYARHPQVRSWPELAGLEARLFRERAEPTQDRALFGKAAEAYRRVFEFDPSQHYPGGQAVAMALLAGDQTTVDALLPRVIALCESEAQAGPASFWLLFTLAELTLIKGDTALALDWYRRGLGATPAPAARERESALRGARRTASRCALDIGEIEAAFGTRSPA